jgi:hypothetical protein
MGEYNDVTLMYLNGGEFKIQVKMVQETTCGLLFQLTKGGINDEIKDDYHIEIFNNKYARWASNFPHGKL